MADIRAPREPQTYDRRILSLIRAPSRRRADLTTLEGCAERWLANIGRCKPAVVKVRTARAWSTYLLRSRRCLNSPSRNVVGAYVQGQYFERGPQETVEGLEQRVSRAVGWDLPR